MKIKATEKVLYKDVNWNPATNYISKFDLESLVEKAIAINNEPSQKPSETPINIDFLPDTGDHQDTSSETQSMDGLYEYKPSAAGTEFVPIVRPRISAVQRQEEAKKNREAKEARLMHEALVEYGELGITYECMSLELPSSYMEAADDPKWEEAMAKEMESFRKHGVFSPVKYVNGMKLVGGKWVYALKRCASGLTSYKARYVAQGYSQRPGLDYTQTYAPTTMTVTLRIVITIIASTGMNMHQLDVSTAFLHGDIDTDIYMKPPEGYKPEYSSDTVMKVNKSIYGLKQAGRMWNQKIHSVLIKIGLTATVSDPTIYYKIQENESTFLMLFVDDMLLASSSMASLEHIKSKLRESFDIKDLGEANTFIGIDITRDLKRHTISLNQTRYIEDMVIKYQLSEELPLTSPSPPLQRGVENSNGNLSAGMRKQYQSLIGALMWIATNTRPDISAVVGKAAQSVANPTNLDRASLVNIVRYLNTTKYESLVLGGTGALKPVCFVDASWAGDTFTKSDSRSRHGAIITYGIGCVLWWSRLQSTVAQSSAEAEYLALAEVAKDIRFISLFLGEIGAPVTEPIVVSEDNSATIHMATNGMVTRSTRHIAIRERLAVQEVMNQKSMRLEKIGSTENVADMLTKPLGRVKLKYFKQKIGVINNTGRFVGVAEHTRVDRRSKDKSSR
ncbi:DNA-directed DNA polymerase [Synchytrium endobioticum]|uniref:DNA-directed DNA polymerase n=1 Tax=Synchytrium endobioticum TaxID=286115 RepID=A0A507DGU4_9FUNG|nr:DNA-directed DNA polymerase [Synchytrium endobioticum]